MAVYEFTSPEGKVYEIEGPEGSSQEQAFEKFKELRPELFAKGEQVPYLDLLQKEKKPRYDIKQGAKDVGQAGLVGAITGAFTPEIVKGAGYGMKAIPQLHRFSEPVIEAGKAMKGVAPRAKGAGAGAFGGGIGETAGQAVEAYGGTPGQAEAARFVGGMAGPEALLTLGRAATGTGGYLLSKILDKSGLPIGTTARTIGQMLEDKSITEANLTQKQREFIEQKIQAIRGGEKSFEPMKDIMGMLQAASNKIIREADTQAKALESEGQNLIAQAQFAGGRLTQDAEKRISRLQSQFNQAFDRVKQRSEDQAKFVIEQANVAAKELRDAAAKQAPEVQAAAKAQADQLIAAGRKQADDLTAQAKQQLQRLSQTRDSLLRSIPARKEAAAQEIGAVGERVTPTDLGTQLRNQFSKVFESLKATREANVKKYKDEAFSAALQKEQAGTRYQQMPEFRDVIQSITDEIVDPQTGLARAIPEQRDQLTKVRDLLVRGIGRKDPQTDQIVYQPLSFNGLETLRRQLRDRASGLPAEGYDAINQQQAGRLADRVEKIMEDFSPGLRKYLNQYREDSKPLNQFKNKLGKAMVGVEDFDFSQFVTDASKLAGAAFSSASTVRQLINTIGEQPSEQFARSFLADRIRGGAAKDVQKAIDDSRDWIGIFPNLQNQLAQAARNVGIEERVISKRESLAKSLRTKMGAFPERFGQVGPAARRAEESALLEAQRAQAKGETAATGILSKAEKAAEKAETKGLTEAETITKELEKQRKASEKSVGRQATTIQEEARKASEKQLTEAEKAAGVLTKEAAGVRQAAQQNADIILGGKTPVERVMGFLLGAKAEEWAAISPIIKSTPGGRERLADAVSQTIANRAEQSLKGAIADMELMREKLVDNGLMAKADADKIVDRLQEIFVTPISEKARITMAQRLIRNAIAGYAAPGVERGTENILELIQRNP